MTPNALVFRVLRKLHLNFKFLAFFKKWLLSFNLVNPSHEFLKDYCYGTVVDVGANVGDYSKFFLKSGAKEVHAFEPMPEFFNKLIHRGVIAHCILLGNDEEVTLFYYKDNSAINSVIPREGMKVKYVMQAKLDSYHLNDVSLIKIDAEGMDYEVLLGAKDTIIRNHPAILIECNNEWLGKRGYSKKNIIEFMESLGYKGKEIYGIYDIEPNDMFFSLP